MLAGCAVTGVSKPASIKARQHRSMVGRLPLRRRGGRATGGLPAGAL
jgi:hypothetical protein